MQHRQAQRLEKAHLKGKICGLFFCIVGFCKFVCVCEFMGYYAMQRCLSGFFVYAVNMSE